MAACIIHVGKRQQRYNHGEEWPSFIVAATMHRHMSRRRAVLAPRAIHGKREEKKKKGEEKKEKKETGSRRSVH